MRPACVHRLSCVSTLCTHVRMQAILNSLPQDRSKEDVHKICGLLAKVRLVLVWLVLSSRALGSFKAGSLRECSICIAAVSWNKLLLKP